MRYHDPNYPKRIGNVIHGSRTVTLLATTHEPGVGGFVIYTRDGIFVPKTPNLAKFRLPVEVFAARYSETA